MAADKALSEHPAPVAPRAPENTQRGTVRELMGLLVKAQMGLYDGKNAISEKLECDLFSRLTEFLVSEALRAELASKVAMETSATAMDSRMFLDLHDLARATRISGFDSSAEVKSSSPTVSDCGWRFGPYINPKFAL